MKANHIWRHNLKKPPKMSGVEFELPVLPQETTLETSLNKQEVEQDGMLTLNMSLKGKTPEPLEYKVSLLHDQKNFEITPNSTCTLSSNGNCKLSIKSNYAAHLGKNSVVLTPINNEIETPGLEFNTKYHKSEINSSSIYLIKDIDKVLSAKYEDQLKNFGVIVLGFATPCINKDVLDLSGKICGIGDNKGISHDWGRFTLSQDAVSFIKHMQAKYGTKFVVSFREPSDKANYEKMFQNEEYYSKLANNFAEMAHSYSLNGADYDYEPKVWAPENWPASTKDLNMFYNAMYAELSKVPMESPPILSWTPQYWIVRAYLPDFTNYEKNREVLDKLSAIDPQYYDTGINVDVNQIKSNHNDLSKSLGNRKSIAGMTFSIGSNDTSYGFTFTPQTYMNKIYYPMVASDKVALPLKSWRFTNNNYYGQSWSDFTSNSIRLIAQLGADKLTAGTFINADASAIYIPAKGIYEYQQGTWKEVDAPGALDVNNQNTFVFKINNYLVVLQAKGKDNSYVFYADDRQATKTWKSFKSDQGSSYNKATVLGDYLYVLAEKNITAFYFNKNHDDRPSKASIALPAQDIVELTTDSHDLFAASQSQGIYKYHVHDGKHTWEHVYKTDATTTTGLESSGRCLFVTLTKQDKSTQNIFSDDGIKFVDKFPAWEDCTPYGDKSK